MIVIPDESLSLFSHPARYHVVKLHFLGTTGYHPNNHRQTACLMMPEIGVILDAGTGIFRARDLIQTSTLDIFLSHLHLDHSVGLTFLYDVLLDKNVDRVTVHVAAEKMETIRHRLYCEDLFPVQPNFELRELKTNGGTKLGKAGLITAFPVDHPGGCHSFRIDWADSNRSFAYVTDTTACLQAPYVQKIQGVETLIHECYFPDGWEEKAKLTGHSCLTPVAEVARAAGVGQCLLVHVDPLDESKTPLDLESIKGIFKNMSVAEDFQVIEV